MAKYIVFEETGEVRPPKRGEAFTDGNGGIEVSAFDYDTIKFPILRRLTDAEVEALVVPKPADDERERFVRETAARFMASPIIDPANNRLVYQNIDDAIANAESLAARLWEKRA